MRDTQRHIDRRARVNQSPTPKCLRANLPPEMAIGKMLGHYRLLERISRGGMGIVFRAHDENLQRDVALKVLVPVCFDDAIARTLLHNEALILSKLNHPNIVTVHDFATKDGIDFLVMEYVPGQTLSTRLERGPISELQVRQIGKQIAAAVQEAHARGIVHRDLKPQNVILTPGGLVKVADFGLAKVLVRRIAPAANMNVTRDLELGGTLAYMPPEQLRGDAADFRSDIYSAGAVLYELATGQPPFPETHGPRLLDSILHDVPGPPSTLISSLSRQFEIIVTKCLEKEPSRRYQSASELGIDLEHLAPLGITATEMGADGRATDGTVNQSRLTFCGIPGVRTSPSGDTIDEYARVPDRVFKF